MLKKILVGIPVRLIFCACAAVYGYYNFPAPYNKQYWWIAVIIVVICFVVFDVIEVYRKK